MKTIFYLGFYTEEYTDIYNRYLKKSLEKFNLPNVVYKIKSSKSWLFNGNKKYSIILNELKNSTCQYLVYLDADAEILKFPNLFYNISDDYDLGVCYLDWRLFWGNPDRKNPEVLGGTIYIKNSVNTIHLFETIVENIKKFNQPGQLILEDILNNLYYNIYKLPLSYCQIIKKNGEVPQETVIAQWQLSRIMKNNV